MSCCRERQSRAGEGAGGPSAPQRLARRGVLLSVGVRTPLCLPGEREKPRQAGPTVPPASADSGAKTSATCVLLGEAERGSPVGVTATLSHLHICSSIRQALPRRTQRTLLSRQGGSWNIQQQLWQLPGFPRGWGGDAVPADGLCLGSPRPRCPSMHLEETALFLPLLRRNFALPVQN